jgi:hypothetical protein
MTFSTHAPHKKRRWLAVFAILAIALASFATTASAHLSDAIPASSYISDTLGADDEPGQKDLTALASAYHEGSFYAAWKWDDTSWSGKNSGDGCALFDSDGDQFTDYAVCATIGGKTVTLSTLTVYSCNDAWEQRCGNPVLLGTFSTTAGTYCLLTASAAGTFDTADTQIVCDITAISTALDPDVAALAGANLINTCSYPSREPNSDPSDCVFETVALTSVVLDTASGGSIAWQATLTDQVNSTPAGSGTVVFGLYTDSACTVSAGFTSASLALTAGSASTSTSVITSLNDPGSGTYYWKVTYTPSAGFGTADALCGEPVTVTASVAGSTQP